MPPSKTKSAGSNDKKKKPNSSEPLKPTAPNDLKQEAEVKLEEEPVEEKPTSPSPHASRASTPAAASPRRKTDGDLLVIPHESELMRGKELNTLADQLSRSLVVLRTRLARMEQRQQYNGTAAVLPFQIRRARAEREQLEVEVKQTDRTIKRLLLMSEQMQKAIGQREMIIEQTRQRLTQEIDVLKEQKEKQENDIRSGYIERINMLQRYWPWRQLLELGDTAVGATFEEELARGPRYRNVGIQNNIQSDYIQQQLQWVEQIVSREEVFRNHLRHLDNMVEDLGDINELLESTLTCTVCGLLFEAPVLFWPCGHTFCQVCFDSLAIAPSLYRCPTCGSIGSEGYVHNLLVADSVAKWLFKDSGYGELQEPLNRIRVHLSRFKRSRMEDKIEELKELLATHKALEKSKNSQDMRTIDITYRAF